jgi:hypothetical protein
MVRYAVRVTGWSHGKPVSALCGNGRRWLTRDEAEAVAAGWLAHVHKAHPRTASLWTAVVVEVG